MNWREFIFASICFSITGFAKAKEECVFGVWVAATVLWATVWLPRGATCLYEACAQLLFIGINTTAAALMWKYDRPEVAWACSLGASLRLFWGFGPVGMSISTVWVLTVAAVASTQCASHVSRETVVIGLLWPPVAHTISNLMKKFIQTL